MKLGPCEFKEAETINTILSMVNLKHLIFAITEVSRELFIFNKFHTSNLRNKGKHGLLFMEKGKQINNMQCSFHPHCSGK